MPARHPPTQARNGPWPRSGTPRTATTPAAPSLRFKLAYGAKFGKAVAKIVDDIDELLAFYDYPGEHWVHLRTTKLNFCGIAGAVMRWQGWPRWSRFGG